VKAKFLLGLAVLALAGCAFDPVSPVSEGDWGERVPDALPMPAKGMTPAAVHQMYSLPGSEPVLT
jgi:hypothetical protein